MKVLITGGAGFVGSNLCALLLKQGHQVWAVDNFLTGIRENPEAFRENPHFTFAECGVETKEFLDFCSAAGVTFDRVYHLACPTGVPNIELLGEEMMDVCSQGTKNVLQVAREHKAKLVFTSSSEIYGEPQVSPQSENYTGNVDPIGWRANYEEGKRFSETWVALFVHKYKVHASIVRLFNVYGPRMSLAETRVVPTLIRQAINGQPLTVHGEGSQQRTLCFVDDLLEALTLVMEKGQGGEVYNLGSDKAVTMLDLAKKIVAVTGSTSQIVFTPRASHDHSSRMPVLDKIHGLGWRQRIPLEQGLQFMVEDFRRRLPASQPDKVVAQDIELKSFIAP